MKIKPSIKVEEVIEDYIYQSSSPLKEIGRDFRHPFENKYIAEVNDRSIRNENARNRDDLIVEATLNALGVETKNSYSAIYLLCSILLNAKILLDSEDYVMVESVNGYIKNVAKGEVFKQKYLDQFIDVMNGCYKVEDGVIILDEEKYNEMMTAVL